MRQRIMEQRFHPPVDVKPIGGSCAASKQQARLRRKGKLKGKRVGGGDGQRRGVGLFIRRWKEIGFSAKGK